jgi:hypothetical protein
MFVLAASPFFKIAMLNSPSELRGASKKAISTAITLTAVEISFLLLLFFLER